MQDNLENKSLATKDIFEVADELEKSLKERTEKPLLPTGIEPLDDLIWGVHRKELLVIASRPSQGKTSLTLNVAWNLAKLNKKILYISLEMSASSCLERILCNEFEINGWRLRKGFPQEREMAMSSMDKLKSRLMLYPITILDDACFTKNELEDTIKLNRAEVFFVDHLQRISSRGYKNRHECLADYVQECKRQAMQQDCCAILASQINRQGSGEGNAMDFMKGTGEIEEGADTLLQLNWTGRDKLQKNPEDLSIDLGEYHIKVIKQRHGAIDSAKVMFNVANYKFEQYPEANTFTHAEAEEDEVQKKEVING